MIDKKKRILCCGDSITFGLAATSAKNSYPSVLQVLLGDDFEVKNFGRSGATVINDYEERADRYSPYVKCCEFSDALKAKPDTVILMLGMNDANPTHHFNENNGGPISEYYLEIYKTTLSDIIAEFKKITPSPAVYLAWTTEMKRVAGELFSQRYVDNFTENLVKIRKIQEDIAKSEQIPLIDTISEMQNSIYYSDGCHLTDEGYSKLASIIYEALQI